MKNVSILFIAFLSLAVISCKDNTKETELEVVTVDNSAEAPKEAYEVAKMEAEFNDPKMEAIFNQYLEVENALINTDAEKTSSESSKLLPMLQEMQVEEPIQNAVSEMAESNDIKVQRENFEELSSGMEKMLQGTLKSGKLYKQFCPMAFNNKGAYWISSGKDILNPYFGDKMLKCGRVDSEIQ
ncbi:DUF3347 domain-containing protein [Aequorivita sp. H23M31]|uniref:DUF3347 domain-containing protein n=1 Tax=Aequorivita ciconiae TaxID=2494375 RepID=A0A410G316_9FLAO|nr:DUF3347 domain-containing protein [Aequorivita sp. H23M31]QAA81639.1 DUF3347 domain-containing protein [Aequorivita sp. H23M31]